MIHADNLWKQYGKHGALQGLSFNVPAGSAYALIGANGAGKTTTIKLLMNIIEPTRGSASLFGIDSRKLSPRELCRIGYVSENQQMPLALTVDEYLAYLKPFYPKWDSKKEQALRRQFRLPGDRKIGDLSHGMRMKMALTSALAFNPELLILDEPLNGLDPLVRDEFMEGMLEQAGQMTVFISSHDLGDIDGFATHVAFVDSGKLLFEEPMDSLMARFREVEITLEDPPRIPPNTPADWLHMRVSGSVLTFVDSKYSEKTLGEMVARYWGTVRRVETRPINLRSVFTNVARAASQKADQQKGVS